MDDDEISKRTARRDSLLLAADLRDSADRPIGSARVRNLSATGLMAESDARVTEGDRLSLSLRGVGTIGATVSWVRAGRIGVAFDEAIDPAAARRPVSQAPAMPVQPASTGYTPARFPRRPR